VEFALVVGPLILLLFMILEGGLLLRAHAEVGSTVSGAVRSGSIAGAAGSADHEILQHINARSSSPGNIRKVVIFHAQPGDDGPPSLCLSAPSSSLGAECNVYTASDLTSGASAFGCSGNDRFWCPTQRQTGIENPDYVGVYVETEHRLVSGILSRVFVLSDSAILPLEDPT